MSYGAEPARLQRAKSGQPISALQPVERLEQAHPLVISPAVKARKSGLWMPLDLTLETWSEIGEQIAAIGDSSAWWLGDWLIYGKKRFPNRYKQAISETSLEYQTLRNYAWVCRRFPVLRRRRALSFQHHAEVASLPPGEQDEWLEKAENLGWSVHQLRRQLRAGEVGRRREPGNEFTLKLAITASQRERWKLAADSVGTDMEEWIVTILDRAVAGMSDI